VKNSLTNCVKSTKATQKIIGYEMRIFNKVYLNFKILQKKSFMKTFWIKKEGW